MCLLLINPFAAIPAVRLTCVACFSPISQSIFVEIFQGLFSSHAANTIKFSSKNTIQLGT